MDNQPPTPQTPPAAPNPMAQPVVPQPMYAAPVAMAPAENPGKVLGIVGIVLGFVGLSLVGLPLSIVSMVKSKKVGASSVLGIVGLVLNILLLIIGSIVIILVALSYNGIQQRAHEAQDQANSKMAATPDVSIDSSYSVTGGNAYWAFPGAYNGWTVDTFDKAGVNRMMRDDNGAYFMSYQGKDTYTQSDKEATRQGITDFLKAGDATKSGSESTRAFPQMSNGKTVEFIVQEYSFSKSGVSYRGILAARVFDGGRILLLTYAASASTYADSEWSALSAKMQINDGAV